MYLATDPWMVGLGTGLLGAILIAFAKALYSRALSLKGAFSGRYISLTYNSPGTSVLVEVVQCRNSGYGLKGTIRGVGLMAVEDLEGHAFEKTSNTAKYVLEGFVSGRVFVVSYKSAFRGVHSVGTFTLKGGDSGHEFHGIWTGVARGQIEKGECSWIRVQNKAWWRRVPDSEYIADANRYLKRIKRRPPPSSMPKSGLYRHEG